MGVRFTILVVSALIKGWEGEPLVEPPTTLNHGGGRWLELRAALLLEKAKANAQLYSYWLSLLLLPLLQPGGR